ncbi:MAG: DNA repair protein RecN [Terriglobales bacterium]
MLLSLHIENYALIDRLTVEFAPGLNVLSGETGSGKSIVVDALALLLGQRAEASAVRAGEERASVAGIFAAAGSPLPLEEMGLEGAEEVIIRREIGGRGRVWINDQPATVAALRRLAPGLAQVHAQDEAAAGWAPAAQLARLDAALGGGEELAALAAAYAAWRAARRELDDGLRQDQERLREADLWRFQREELAAAGLRLGEDAELEAEQRRLANAEKIGAAAAAAYAALYDDPQAAAVGVKAALRQVQELARLEPEAASLAPRLEALRIEIADLAAVLPDWMEPPEAAPERLARVQERLTALDKIKRKYGPDLAAALDYAQELDAKLERLERREEWRAEAEGGLQRAEAAYRQAALSRSARRREEARWLQVQIAREAAELAMKVRLEIAFAAGDASAPAEEDWGPAGWDQIRFLAATNPGEPLQPFDRIASGGERSRLVLALETAALARHAAQAAGPPPTRVFDEIDAGIGGRAAEAVGRKLAALARRDQVLCVTHLAQIACHADRHLRVEKTPRQGRVVTRVMPLDGSARVEEIARMLAGATTSAACRHAEELLQKAAGA